MLLMVNWEPFVLIAKHLGFLMYEDNLAAAPSAKCYVHTGPMSMESCVSIVFGPEDVVLG